MNRVAKLIRQERKHQGFTLQALASKLGWKNLNKGARRLDALEHGSRINQDVFDSLIGVLGLDAGEVNELALLDHDERVTAWARHMAELRSLELYWHPLPSVAIEEKLPIEAQLDLDIAIERAMSLAKQRGVRVTLRVNGAFSYLFFPDGRYASFGGPYSTSEESYLLPEHRAAEA